jgi:hypothetical protein
MHGVTTLLTRLHDDFDLHAYSNLRAACQLIAALRPGVFVLRLAAQAEVPLVPPLPNSSNTSDSGVKALLKFLKLSKQPTGSPFGQLQPYGHSLVLHNDPDIRIIRTLQRYTPSSIFASSGFVTAQGHRTRLV